MRNRNTPKRKERRLPACCVSDFQSAPPRQLRDATPQANGSKLVAVKRLNTFASPRLCAFALNPGHYSSLPDSNALGNCCNSTLLTSTPRPKPRFPDGLRTACYICSRVSIPSDSKPCFKTRAVRSQRSKRLARSCGSDFKTGQFS